MAEVSPYADLISDPLAISALAQLAQMQTKGGDDEAAQLYRNYLTNRQWVSEHAGGNFQTHLADDQEKLFKAWVDQNKVPFNVDGSVQDYDMRGFWSALEAKDPRAVTAIDPNDQKLHFPDYWKTPYHQTFSNESQWADPKTAPKWNEQDQLVSPSGVILFDDKKKKTKMGDGGG